MKKEILFTAFLLFFVFNSCTNSTQSEPVFNYDKIEKLHGDVVFQDYLSDLIDLGSKLHDVNTFNSYIEDGVLTEIELSNIPKLFGYDDSAQFWKERSENQGRVNQLLKTYDFKNVDQTKMMHEVEAVFNVKSFSNSARVVSVCEKIRRTCLIAVAAEATVMHFGCAALDLAVVPGLICHGAAITYQAAASENCNLEAQRCNN